MQLIPYNVLCSKELRKKVVMASIDVTAEPFALQFDPYCLGMCSWTACPGNADVAIPASQSLPKSECDLSLGPSPYANESHPSMSLSRFAYASKELSKIAEGITPANTVRVTAWATNVTTQEVCY